jgi:Fe-S oxidoreductase
MTETEDKSKSEKIDSDVEFYLNKIYDARLENLLRKCYQCGRCSGVCQLSKVQKYTPSRIIQMILEGFEDKIIDSGILWDCLTCNTCLQYCPEDINFADIARMAKYKMRNLVSQNPEEYIAHKGIYTTISEIMSQPSISPERNLDWIPKECKISDKGNILYYVGCLPFFNYEFEDLNNIATGTLRILCQIEDEPIVVLKEEICCGHDLYWGQGNFEPFIKLAIKNKNMFEKAGVSKLITACAECYRTFKVDYQNLFDDFNEKIDVQHIIEYVYDNWKQNKITFKNNNEMEERISFTYHDPCRLSRFLPKDNNIMDKVREIFKEFKKFGYDFTEMEHHKENSLCCGVSCWMNCNEKSKALRYKRMLEAKSAGTIMIESCPKCRIHLSCLQNDFEDLSAIKIIDFSEFIIDHIEIITPDKASEVKK